MNNVEKNINKDIELVAKLLNDENSSEQNNFTDARNALYNEICENFMSFLEDSSIPEKEKIYKNIIEIADNIDFFRNFPNLLGKTFIGIIGFEPELTKQGLKAMVGDKTSDLAIIDSNLPIIFVDKIEKITAINDIGNSISLSFKEYDKTNRYLCRYLWRKKVEIPQLLQFYLLNQDSSFTNIAFVYFPLHCNFNTLFAKMIISKLDACVVYLPEPSLEIKKRKITERFVNLQKKQNIPCYFIATTENIQKFKSDKFFTNIDISTGTSFFSNLDKMNILSKKYLFVDFILSELLKVKYFYIKEIDKIKQSDKDITSDLINITVQETKSAVTNLRDELSQKRRQLEEEYNKFKQCSVLLRDKAKEYEEQIDKFVSKNSTENIGFSSKNKEIWNKIFFQTVDICDYQLAMEYFKKIQQLDNNYKYVYNMIIKSAKGEELSSKDLRFLCNEYDNEFIRKAKMRLAKELSLTEDDYMEIAHNIEILETPIEFYYSALWEEKKGNKKKAISFYKKSLEAGFEKAGTKLFEIDGNNKNTLLFLSDQMVPEANFELGKIYMTEKKSFSADRCFKLSAVKKYLPAIKNLTEKFYRLLYKRENLRDGISESEKERVQTCINLFKYILSKESYDSDNINNINEQIGNLYYLLKDYRRALDFWEKSKTANSYYNIGRRLFQYGNDSFPQDLERAIDCFSKANDLGHPKAWDEYKKVKSWQEDNKRKAEEKRNISYSPTYDYDYDDSSSSSSSSSGWCFITTAVCSTLNRPDDCDELNTLRKFRDKIKLENPIVAALIDEYYRIAPIIVEKIDSKQDSLEVYSKLWKNFISKIYNLLKNDRNDEATIIYIDMVKQLCETYGVKMADGIEEKINLLLKK